MDSSPTEAVPMTGTGDEPATESRRRILRVLAAAGWTGVIMILCWIPGTVVHHIEDDSRWFKIPNLDKLVHGTIFVLFPIFWARLGTSRARFGWIFLGGLALAVLTEAVQTIAVIGRDGNLSDGAIDVVGLLIGLAAVPMVEPFIQAIESRIIGGTSSRATTTTQDCN
jgi:hypothetical protein